MAVRANYIAGLLEELAPRGLAEEWDNVGWQVGDSQAEVSAVLVALDPSPAALAQAKTVGAELMITHHPLIFRPLKRLRLDIPAEALIAQFLAAKVGVYTLHTNLDNSPQGTSAVLARKLGLVETTVLSPSKRQQLYKLVTFVPPAHIEAVRRAVTDAGAGWIGKYSHCTFQTAGTGTFLPQEGTTPFIGEIGRLEYTDELRLETIVPAERLGQVVEALQAAHPYEEVAYDVYPLVQKGQAYGLGCLGLLPEVKPLADFAQQVKTALSLSALAVVGEEDKPIGKVAVCGGSGSSKVHQASSAGADVLVTGDVKYHDAQDAALLGLALIDAGHAGTENPLIFMLADYLTRRLKRHDVTVHTYCAPDIFRLI